MGRAVPRRDRVVTLLDTLARLEGRLLVAMDFDGTLSEIVARPHDARSFDGVDGTLTSLVAREDTNVAVVSGRSLTDLQWLVPVPGVILVGEHGAVWEGEEPGTPDGFGRVRDVLEVAAKRQDGAWVEVKQTSLVLHTRGLERAHERQVLEAAVAALESIGHTNFHLGKSVVDVGFVEMSKGVAVDWLRANLACDIVVFAGDDTTDETVFERLQPGDIGVKVGPGVTAAHHRVDGPADVVTILGVLAARAASGGDSPDRDHSSAR